MSRKIVSWIFCLTILCQGNVFSGHSSEVFNIGKYKIGITFYSPVVVRVRISASDTFSSRNSLSVIALPQSVDVRRKIAEGTTTLSSGELSVILSLKDCALFFKDQSGRIILEAAGIDESSLVRDTVAGENVYHARQNFHLSRDEGLYGLGQFEDVVMNYRRHDVNLTQANRTSVNPFLISTNGYGILWDNYSRSRFVDSDTATFFWSEVADQIDYYFCYGHSMDAVIAGYRFLTGAAPMFGKWAYGYWQSKERYIDASELLTVLHEYRTRKIPMDNLVQDWAYWPGNEQFSGMVWDSTRFPSPKAMVDSIHNGHAHVIVSIWPAFGIQSNIFKEMKEKGYLYPVTHWNGGLVYDAYNPDARSLYWKYIKKGMVDNGIDGFWTDATEPEFRCTDDRFITELSMRQAGRNTLGTFARYLNSFSLMTTQGLYKHHREATSAKRVFLLTRSSFAGQQRNGAATWSGDTFASWDNLKVQIASGINFSMAGIPYWNSDIGGFITGFHFPHGYEDPAYKELYVRWFQFGAFSPIFRAHGTNIPREIWRFGKKGNWAYDALITADRLRYRLMPYIYSVAWKVTSEGYSFLRGLPMSFPGDKRTYNIAGQFLFGPSLMVCPVVRPLQYEPEYRGIDITPEHFLSPDGKTSGALISIFRGLSFDKLVLHRRIDVGQIAWFGCVPAELDTAYSVRINGQLRTDTSGLHTFYIKTDGGVRMWLNDTLLIDRWDNREEQTLSAEYPLESSHSCRFVIEHRQFKPQTANFKMNWIKPDAPSFADKNINVYLPKHRFWYNFWSGEAITGGRTIQVLPPIGQIPLFVPCGSIVPIGPEIQYAMQKTDEPVELRIYAGENAEFTLYDDEGDTYDYEKHQCIQIPIRWNEYRKILTLGAQIGSYHGAPVQRTFHIVLVGADHGVGVESTANPDKIITYRQKAMTIKLKR
ncbi:MAG: TIM-barrel domain-containing protein [Bacteroidota bacterium]